MGREIRRVPMGWEHPRRRCPHNPWNGGCDEAKAHGGQCLQPLFDEPFALRAKEWVDECMAWERGDHPDLAKNPELKTENPFYWQWNGGPPDEEYYRPEWPADAVLGYAMYETVSEGTPLSPTCATPEALVDWLSMNRDYWGHGPMDRAVAENFVRLEWAPSMIAADGVLYDGPEGMLAMKQKDES